MVPRHEEESFISVKCEAQPRKVVQEYVPFPPLMRHLMMTQQNGQSVEDIPMLKLAIKKGVTNRAVLDTQVQK